MRMHVWIVALLGTLLAGSSAFAQELRPQVVDQNRSGAPQSARKGKPAQPSAAEVAVAAAEAQEKGMSALEAQRFGEAVQHLRQAVDLAPEDVPSRFYLAQALAQSGKEEESLPHYEKLVEMQPELVEARLNYAQVLTSLERHGEAAEQLEAASRLKPDDPSVRFQLGYAELRAGEAEKARARFARLVEDDPRDADHHYGLGQAYFLMKDLDAAEASFREAAQRDPRYRNGLLAVAEAWQEAGGLEKAAALFGEFPENADAARRAGELLVELGKNEEAIASLEAGLASAPTFANRRNLAVAYQRAGKPEKALAVLEAAIAAEPGNVEAHLALARTLRDARRFPQAAARFQQALKLDAANLSAWNEFAAVAMLAGEFQAALDAIALLEKQGALSAGHSYLRAIIFDRFQQDDAALSAYEAFLATSKGENADEEFKARQRVRMLKNKKRR
ncbi:MAG: tetratricopeptide repeat protein [Bryobacterales bacterium]|jgi:tetratricopeptide (TPR) repeat protein|nr:tetratricopeptide repeat protein [Bryobacterales bacterium]